MHSVEQLAKPGRVYQFSMDEDYGTAPLENVNADTKLNLVLVSADVVDGKNTVEKLATHVIGASGEVAIEFDITNEELITLLGNDIQDGANKISLQLNVEATDASLFRTTFLLGTGEGQGIATFLDPVIKPDSDSTRVDAPSTADGDEYCEMTFEVTAPVEVEGEVNDVSNEIVSVYYQLHHGTTDISSGTVEYSNVGDVSNNQTSFTYVSGGDNHKAGMFKLTLGGLDNGTIYETSFRVKNAAGKNSNWSTSMTLRPTAKANAIQGMNITTKILDGSNVPDPSNVNMAFTWTEPDAQSYFIGESLPKIRIGKSDIIVSEANNNSTNNYNRVVANVITYEISRGELELAAGAGWGANITLDLTTIGVSVDDLQTEGVLLKAQVLHDTHADGDADENKLQGIVSGEFKAYLQTVPTLDTITVTVDVSSGEQTFTVEGTVTSEDPSGVYIVWDNSGARQVVADASSTDVLVSGNQNIEPQELVLTYAQLAFHPTIGVSLTQWDRNGTLESIGGEVIQWSANQSFDAVRFQTPVAPEIEFYGNETDGSELRTELTDLRNWYNADDIDGYKTGTADSVRYELYNVVSGGNVLVDVSYDSMDMQIIGYTYNDNATDYWLSATRYGELENAVKDRYQAAGANLSSEEISPVIHRTGARKGPFKRTTSDSLMLNPIQVDVDVSTGSQTYYISGEIDSLISTDATLTVTDGSRNIINRVDISFNVSEANGTFEQSVTRTFENLVEGSNALTLTAEITQPNFNAGGPDFSSDMKSNAPTFETHPFKTPGAATATLIKNEAANDGKLKASYNPTTDLRAMNGYDIVNLTAVITGTGLSDISGAFDDVDDADAPNRVKTNGGTQTIDIAGGYIVDQSYAMNLIKGYRLPNDIFTRYFDANKTFPAINQEYITYSTGVHTATTNTVYYMGNPTITDVDISGQAIIVTADTHGTTLTNLDAFTLVLVAKDGLAGYATGALKGHMGTAVTLSDTDIQGVDGYTSDANAIAATGNQAISYTFTNTANNLAITNQASSIVIMDVTNGHSAVSLSNFPQLDVDANGDGKLANNYNTTEQ
jgi:hypothetical protein